VPPKAKKTGMPGIKTATIHKKLNFLSAPINHQLRNKKPKVRFNPFRAVVPNINDATRKSPLYNEDLNAIDEAFFLAHRPDFTALKIRLKV
jgi:hypothetical protein